MSKQPTSDLLEVGYVKALPGTNFNKCIYIAYKISREKISLNMAIVKAVITGTDSTEKRKSLTSAF